MDDLPTVPGVAGLRPRIIVGDDMLVIARILKFVVCTQLNKIASNDYLKHHGEV